MPTIGASIRLLTLIPYIVSGAITDHCFFSVRRNAENIHDFRVDRLTGLFSLSFGIPFSIRIIQDCTSLELSAYGHTECFSDRFFPLPASP